MATPGQMIKLLQLFQDVPSDHLQKILESGLLADLCNADPGKIVRSDFRKACGLGPVFQFDMTKEGWTGPPEDVDSRINSVSNLELLSFLKPGESYVNGEVMKKRAEEQNANFGQLDAEWLLDHQSEIPKEFRKYYLVFPGTVWQDSSGRRYVAYLSWCDDGWYLVFDWLDCDWDSGSRLLSFRK